MYGWTHWYPRLKVSSPPQKMDQLFNWKCRYLNLLTMSCTLGEHPWSGISSTPYRLKLFSPSPSLLGRAQTSSCGFRTQGFFSVKSAYKEMLPNTPSQVTSIVNWSKLWKIRGLERIKMFLWRVAINTLPMRENLMSRMDIPVPWCVLCNQEVESASHLFLKCPVAKAP